MANPVVHFEIRSADPDAARTFFGQVFDWKFSPGAIPGYTYVEHGVEGAIPGAIGPTQGGPPMVTFFVVVDDVAETLATAERLGGKTIQPAASVPGITFAAFADPQGQIVGIVKPGWTTLSVEVRRGFHWLRKFVTAGVLVGEGGLRQRSLQIWGHLRETAGDLVIDVGNGSEDQA